MCGVKRYTIILLILFLAGMVRADLGAKDVNAQGVEPSRAHIRRSPEAEALAMAAVQAVKDRDWRTAAENYQKAIELYSTALIKASAVDTAINSDLYWGVRHFCGDALRRMPAEGLKAYNSMFEPAARQALESAVRSRLDTEKLAQVAGFYALTGPGRDALILLLRLSLESGEFYKASGYYRELEQYHPETAQGLPERRLIEEFMAGKTSGVEWPAYCGDNTRSKMMVTRASDEVQGHSFSWTGYSKLPAHVINLSRRINAAEIYYPPIIPQESIPYFPVVGNGMIYLPTGSGIYAFQSPEPKEGDVAKEINLKWKVEYDTSAAGFQEERTINTATLSPDGRRLYVPLIGSFEKYERRLGFLDVKYPFPRRSLFCIDTATAKALWTSDRVAPLPDGSNPLEDIIFPVAPAEENGVLYVAGIRMPNQIDIPEHYLFALDARSGAVYFRTFIASGILETNLFNNPSREPVASVVTVDKDNIYYCSQMGAIAAVDKYSGQVKWLKKYEEYQIKPTWPNYTPPRLPLRWANNPVIRIDNTSFATPKGRPSPIQSFGAADGQVIVTAVDSPFLYILSSDNGGELWRWNGDESPLGNVRYLVGIRDGFLVLSGESCLMCLNLNKTGKVEWKVEGGRLNGKSAITDDRIYITSDYALMEVALKSGKLISRNVLQGKDEAQPSANLLVAGDLLIRNSIGQMNIYRIENKKEPVNNEPAKK
ncbi:MAG: hypothetical protein AB1599_09405 [Planctomycetota bacterium]